MKKILLSMAMIGVAGVLAVSATTAIFSDVEKSEGNTFKAGGLDLLVDNTQHYAGMVCADITDDDPDKGYIWVEEETGSSARPELIGEECNGTWEETDLGPTHKFFNFDDVKPGDEGENTISLHIEGNDAYVCAIIDNMEAKDNGCNEPEGLVDSTCDDDTPNEGELQDELHFFAWADMSPVNEIGNNIWEDGEPMLFSNIEGPASDILDGVAYDLYTPATGEAMKGDSTVYIGLYWCLGTLTVDDSTNTLSCNGASATNITQSDSLSADITFYVEQARNNPEFECSIPDPEPEPGTLTIVKEVINDSGTGSAYPDDFTFEIKDSDGAVVASGTQNDYELVAGDYTVTEYPAVGYTADFTACGDGSITVTAGGVVTCTVVNDDNEPTTGTLRIVKDVVGGTASADDFDFDIADDAGALVHDNVAQGDYVLEVGNYTVSEEGFADYTSDFAGCFGDGSVTIVAGNITTCTVVNTRDTGTITVIKEVINDNGGTLEVENFPLNIDGNSVTSGVANTLSVGTYTVGETGQHGYAPTFSGDCDGNGVVNLGLGEDLVCTITNDDIASSITLVKNVLGGSALPDDFLLTLGGTPFTSGSSRSVDAGVAYAIDETQLTGYTFTSITGHGECPVSLGGTITLGLAENATCMITNEHEDYYP